MPLNPVIKRLIQKAYLNDLGNAHIFDEDRMRAYLTHPKIRAPLCQYVDYQTDQEIFLRCYSPQESSDVELPAVIFISATAFVLDRLGASSDYCSLMANALQMKVINIQHRLAPEHKFPIFLDDCVDSIIWIAQNANILQIDPDKIGIWGESSGASIAATCTHVLRDKHLPLLKHQTLFYPMVDLVNEYPSKTEFEFGYMLDKTFIRWLDARGFHPEQDRSDPLVSPLLSQNFSGLPPTTLFTAHYDPLRDEGELYAEKLIQAHVPVFHQRFDDMVHGFMRFYGKIPAAEIALTLACEQVKKHLWASS